MEGSPSSYGHYPKYLWEMPQQIVGNTPTIKNSYHLWITYCLHLLNELSHAMIWVLEITPIHKMTASSVIKKSANISQSNELTEAAYHLPLQAKRVLWLCLMQCYFNKEDPAEESPIFTITVADYQRFFKVGVDTASTDVKKGVSVLADSNVTFYPKEGEFEEVKRPWLAEAGLKRGRGKWQIEFNYKVMPYLMGLTSQFTTYSLYDCGKLRSVKVIRLYESLCQFRQSGIWITTPEWLSERFMLAPSQRTNMAEMKRSFLNPALKNINDNTPLKASMSQDEEGRLIFTILDKAS